MLKNKNLGLIIIVLLFSFIFLYGSLLSKKIEVNENLWTIAIPQNSGLSRVSTILSQNTNVNPVLFKIAMYMTFNQNNIKYGRYDFRYINNMRDLVYTITSSSSMKVKVTNPCYCIVQHFYIQLNIQLKISQGKSKTQNV